MLPTGQLLHQKNELRLHFLKTKKTNNYITLETTS